MVSGAARTIVAKLFYQLGFEHPLFLTLLYLSGQALSLVPYNIWRYFRRKGSLNEEEEDEGSVVIIESHLSLSVRFAQSIFTNESDREASTERRNAAHTSGTSATTHHEGNDNVVISMSSGASDKELQGGHGTIRKRGSSLQNDNHSLSLTSTREQQSGPGKASSKQLTPALSYNNNHVPKENGSMTASDKKDDNNAMQNGEKEREQTLQNSNHSSVFEGEQPLQNSNHDQRISYLSVSVHGLPTQSRTEPFIRKIPWYIKPAVPAFFNLLAYSMRWTSLVYVDASVAEMLISGMELVLSVLATRCVRGRRITWVRWIGVGVCTAGIVLVGILDTMNAANEDKNGGSCSTTANGDNNGGSCSTTVESSSVRDQTIGILLIVGQSIMSVIQGENLAFYLFPFAMMHHLC